MPNDFLQVDHHFNGDLILQLIVSAPGPVRVAWGDGASESVAATSSTPHTYTKAGAFRVTVTGPAGLRQTFSVVAGSPMPAWSAEKVADNRDAAPLDLAAVVGTTGRIG